MILDFLKALYNVLSFEAVWYNVLFLYLVACRVRLKSSGELGSASGSSEREQKIDDKVRQELKGRCVRC